MVQICHLARQVMLDPLDQVSLFSCLSDGKRVLLFHFFISIDTHRSSDISWYHFMLVLEHPVLLCYNDDIAIEPPQK